MTEFGSKEWLNTVIYEISKLNIQETVDNVLEPIREMISPSTLHDNREMYIHVMKASEPSLEEIDKSERTPESLHKILEAEAIKYCEQHPEVQQTTDEYIKELTLKLDKLTDAIVVLDMFMFTHPLLSELAHQFRYDMSCGIRVAALRTMFGHPVLSKFVKWSNYKDRYGMNVLERMYQFGNPSPLDDIYVSEFFSEDEISKTHNIEAWCSRDYQLNGGYSGSIDGYRFKQQKICKKLKNKENGWQQELEFLIG